MADAGDPLATAAQTPLVPTPAPPPLPAPAAPPAGTDIEQPAGAPVRPLTEPNIPWATLGGQLTPFERAEIYDRRQPMPRIRPAGGLPDYNSAFMMPAAGEPFRPFDVRRVIDTALRQTLVGSLMQTIKLRSEIESLYGAIRPDPTYDAFEDPMIAEQGFGDQMHLFVSSRSRNETLYIMRYARMRAADDKAMAEMVGPSRTAAFTGSIVLDPTTYVGMGGVGAKVTSRVAWGYFSASAKTAMAQAATQAPFIFGQRYVDPTFYSDSVLLPLALPAAIGAGVGILKQMERVRSARMGVDPDKMGSRWTAVGHGQTFRRPVKEIPWDETEWLDTVGPTLQGRYVVDRFNPAMAHADVESMRYIAGSDYDTAIKRRQQGEDVATAETASASQKFKTGSPTIVDSFHGTNFSESIAAEGFDLARLGAGTGAPSARQGFFFARRPSTSGSYLQSHGQAPGIIPAQLKFENPLVHDFKGQSYREKSYYDLMREAKEKGHDGVIFLNTTDGHGVDIIYAVFDPKQVKFRLSETFETAGKPLNKELLLANQGLIPERLRKVAPRGYTTPAGKPAAPTGDFSIVHRRERAPRPDLDEKAAAALEIATGRELKRIDAWDVVHTASDGKRSVVYSSYSVADVNNYIAERTRIVHGTPAPEGGSPPPPSPRGRGGYEMQGIDPIDIPAPAAPTVGGFPTEVVKQGKIKWDVVVTMPDGSKQVIGTYTSKSFAEAAVKFGDKKLDQKLSELLHEAPPPGKPAPDDPAAGEFNFLTVMNKSGEFDVVKRWSNGYEEIIDTFPTSKQADEVVFGMTQDEMPKTFDEADFPDNPLDLKNPDPSQAPPAGSVLDSAPPMGDGADGVPQSLSAAAVGPGMAPSANAGLADRESLAETGIGLEKLRYNAYLRAKGSASVLWRKTIDFLVDSGGVMSKKNQTGALNGMAPEATAEPVEVLMARNHTPVLINGLQEIERQWLAARGVKAKAATDMGTTGNALTTMKLWATDMVGMSKGLSLAEFEDRVGRAMARGDLDPVNDNYTTYVNAAARAGRVVLDHEKKMGIDVGLFEKAYQQKLDQATRKLEAVKNDPLRAAEIPAAEFRFRQAQENLDKLKAHGPSANTAPSYFPRYWLVEELRSRADEFLQITENWLVNFKKTSPTEAARIAREIHDTLSDITARPDLTQLAHTFEEALNPSSALARSFEIPDELVESFLERNAGIALRHHVRTMAPDIELMRMFGNTELNDIEKLIRDEYDEVLGRTTDPQERFALNRQRESDVEDLYAVRDKLRGTYGAEKDPHNWSSRTIRVLKNYAVWTTMGLSAFSQLGDAFRPVITEGLDAVNRHGFGTLIDESRALIWRMAHQERLLSGDSLELVMSARSLAASDVGDIYMSRSKLERKANQATGLFYMLNGMNMATDFTKDWASVIIQGRMNDAIERWMADLAPQASNLKKMEPWEIERFHNLGIDPYMAEKIAEQLKTHKAQFKSTSIANTAAWTDKEAQAAYRTALLKSLYRTVVTPGAADKPNWMSSELGSLVMQFRSFGVSSATRTLYAGLQEKGYNFWTGAALLTGGAAVMNEIRKQVFYDKSSFDQPYLGVMADAVDRSGVLGVFFDINNVMEVVSNGELGIRPMLGAGQHYNPLSRVANSLGGPVAGQTFRAVDIVGDIMSGNASNQTWRKMRNMVPGQNLFWADPVFDTMFPSGSGKTGRMIEPRINPKRSRPDDAGWTENQRLAYELQYGEGARP